ncbi:hypothetical protein DES39_0571 [Orbus hercynius]|uniref:Uncharacterized protein n=1 Tax=Orbus hercynius TaxID=593135 RepID=A0A495RJ78_9GAMM|nr:hypothetical protein DES39_0571 [Orbus hercynius]
MITINYLKTIYIRFQYNKHDIINNDSYIIDVVENDHMIMYKDEITIEIARFKQLIDAVEYVKWLCDNK